MKKFEFPLTTLLLVRKLKEEIAHRNLLEAEIVLHKHRENLNSLYKQFDNMVTQIRKLQRGLCDVSRLNELNDYSSSIKYKITQQKFVVREAEISLESSRQKVIHAMQERKIIDNLKLKKMLEWQEASIDQERKENDEISTTQYPRKHE